MLCQFLLYNKESARHTHVQPLLFGFPSHLGHHRALSRISSAVQQVPSSYLFYTQHQWCFNVVFNNSLTSPYLYFFFSSFCNRTLFFYLMFLLSPEIGIAKTVSALMVVFDFCLHFWDLFNLRSAGFHSKESSNIFLRHAPNQTSCVVA